MISLYTSLEGSIFVYCYTTVVICQCICLMSESPSNSTNELASNLCLDSTTNSFFYHSFYSDSNSSTYTSIPSFLYYIQKQSISFIITKINYNKERIQQLYDMNLFLLENINPSLSNQYTQSFVYLFVKTPFHRHQVLLLMVRMHGE